MRIPEHKIDQIRTSANIVDVISTYIQLRKRGRNYIGLCPFHSEKTASFVVTPEKQIFHCFGCHKGGNVFSFLMEYKKISYIESVQELAKDLGITLEYEDSRKNEKGSEIEQYYDLNVEVARFFLDTLFNHPEAEVARKYFESRKIKLATLRAFGLGYSLPAWTFLSDHLAKNQQNIEDALTLGLIGKNDSGGHYDRFMGRVIFPIFSPNGRVVAFAGRILQSKEGTAKYLNSPESKIYYKGRLLYGLSHAKDEIRKTDQVLIVEGYMDLISLYQAGIRNVVAVSGTALTDDQVVLLSRYTRNVCLLFDADTAGVKASMRSVEILLNRNMHIRIAALPEGEDPDSYINKNGKDGFERIIAGASNFLEYQAAVYEKAGLLNDPEKRAETIRELLKPVALLNDKLKQTTLLQSVSERFSLRFSLLEEELAKLISKAGSSPYNRQPSTRPILPKPSGFDLPIEPVSYRVNPNEKEIVKLLFECDSQIITFISQYIPLDSFLDERHQLIASMFYHANENGEDIQPSAVVDKFDDEELRAYFLSLASQEHAISDKWESTMPAPERKQIVHRMIKDTIKKFKVFEIEEEMKSVLDEMKNEKDETLRLELMKRHNQLMTNRNEINEMF